MHTHQIPKGLRYARCRQGHHKWVILPEPLYRDDKTEVAGVCSRCESLAVWRTPFSPRSVIESVLKSLGKASVPEQIPPAPETRVRRTGWI